MKKQTGYITFSAMMAALAVLLMLVSYFPYLTYTVPAFAALFIMVAVIECGLKWATLSYLSAAIITLILAEAEAAVLFVCFFGFYPIIKVLLERIKIKPLKITVKLAVFNASVLLVYLVVMRLMGIDDGFEGYGKYMAYAALVVGNGVFLIYDSALVRLSYWYYYKFHKTVNKWLKK